MNRPSLNLLRSVPVSLVALVGLVRAAAAASPESNVRLWEETITLPTYGVAQPDPNPRFYQGRTYQGARATFYPYPVMDRLTDTREDKKYLAVSLENPYIRISVLPELGGRIFTATDKGNGYDFFYHQHVIKPALIGMLGAWISGGVEWNVPHHHRATSFMPVDYTTTTNSDGSKTVWVGETELRHRMKWLVGLTLYPDRSYIEMSVKLFNRTPLAHPILFWINPAVHANETYQVLFPPGTEWAVQHAKPEFASWPIARQLYGGTDYTRGVDISWWKNHPSPVSFFAWDSDADWFGGYDHRKEAGVLHFADHFSVPGKKFFEWGNGAEGEMWTQVLTDEDGPYLELMAGAWSDNQPDYSWLQPGQVREWKHWWYPIRDMGGVKNASRDAALNLELTNGIARLAVNATTELPEARVRLEMGGKKLLEKNALISPAKPFAAQVTLPENGATEPVRLSLRNSSGEELLAYEPAKPKGTTMPKPVQRPKAPKDYATADELYYTGQRIEQLYSPAFEAAPYYEEILRRDPADYRANTALGILLCRQWRWSEALSCLSNGIARAAANYIRPKDGEAFYYLGLAAQAQGQIEAARNAFAKAAWSAGWQAPADYALAQIECANTNYLRALELVEGSLSAGAHNQEALNLKTTLLRKLGRFPEAQLLASNTLAADPLDFRALNELYLAQRQAGSMPEAEATRARLNDLMRGDVQTHLELALEYDNQGCFSEATDILRQPIQKPSARLYPMIYYCRAHFALQSGHLDEAEKFYALAAQMAPDYCFPGRYEETVILRQALARHPRDARAACYLGNALFDRQPAEAIRAWETAREIDPSLALVHRNLGLAYAQHDKDLPKSIASLEKAVELNPKDARWFYELDVQYEANGAALAQRLNLLSSHREIVEQRDDAATRLIALQTAAGQVDPALQLLRQRHFHNWEGSGELHDIYVNACLRHGLQRLQAAKPAQALQDFTAALDYPRNQEVGKPRRERQSAQVHYQIGAAQEALGAKDKAAAAFELAAGARENAPSEGQFFAALALQKLGKPEEADKIFASLLSWGQSHSEPGAETVDYFAKFGEKRAARLRLAEAHYLAGLGYLGQLKSDQAESEFSRTLELNPTHLGALTRAGTIHHAAR
jgi:tetratricopeptide (TPR) repeat protein